METLRFTEQKTLSKWKNWITEAVLALFLALGIFLCLKDMFQFTVELSKKHWGGIGGGLIATWNQIADVLGKAEYRILPKFAGGSSGNTGFLILFFIWLAILFFFLLKSNNGWLFLTAFLAMELLNVVTGLEIRTATGILYGASILAGVLYTGGKRDFWKKYAFVVVIVVTVAGIFSLPAVKKAAVGTGTVREIRKTLQKTVSDGYYGTNILKNGDLTRREREKGHGEALELTMSNPQSLYLRGFVGESYKGDRWEALPCQTYYDVRELCYWLDADAFQTFGQLGQARDLTLSADEQVRESEVSVKVKGADSRYAYIPYEIKGKLDHGKSWGGSFVTPPGWGRLKEYSFTTGENAVKSWTDTAARVFALAGTMETAALEQYLIDESYYNAFIYEKDTYLSKAERILLKKQIGEAGNQAEGHIDYKPAIQGVQNYLEEHFIYIENLGPASGKKEDALEEFFDTKKGYDVQFATAAVMMFRYYGIPARYVEGYLVTPEDAGQMKNGKTAVIGKDRAHAWVEIYIDGSGFVPIEVCPPYRDVMEEADMDIGISNETLLRPFESKGGSQGLGTELETAGDDDKPFVFPIAIFAGILLAVLFLWLLYRAIQNVCRKFRAFWQRKRLFQKAEPKIAVSAMFSYMEEKEYLIADEIRMLGNKAAYSQMPITEAERSVMIAALKKAAKEKKKDEKKMHFCGGMRDGSDTSSVRMQGTDTGSES